MVEINIQDVISKTLFGVYSSELSKTGKQYIVDLSLLIYQNFTYEDIENLLIKHYPIDFGLSRSDYNNLVKIKQTVILKEYNDNFIGHLKDE